VSHVGTAFAADAPSVLIGLSDRGMGTWSAGDHLVSAGRMTCYKTAFGVCHWSGLS